MQGPDYGLSEGPKPVKQQRIVYIISMNVMQLYHVRIIFLQTPYQLAGSPPAVQAVPVGDAGQYTVACHVKVGADAVILIPLCSLAPAAAKQRAAAVFHYLIGSPAGYPAHAPRAYDCVDYCNFHSSFLI